MNQDTENREDLNLLKEIKIFAFNHVTCTAGVYCCNLEEIRGMINKNKGEKL